MIVLLGFALTGLEQKLCTCMHICTYIHIDKTSLKADREVGGKGAIGTCGSREGGSTALAAEQNSSRWALRRLEDSYANSYIDIKVSIGGFGSELT